MGQQSAIATLLLSGFGIVFLLIGGFVVFQLDTATAGYGRQRVAFIGLLSAAFGLTFLYIAYDR